MLGFTNLRVSDENDNSFTSVSGGFKGSCSPEIVAYIDDVELPKQENRQQLLLI